MLFNAYPPTYPHDINLNIRKKNKKIDLLTGFINNNYIINKNYIVVLLAHESFKESFYYLKKVLTISIF